MKTHHLPCSLLLPALLGLALAALPGCAPKTLKMAPRVINVTAASPAQATEDRQQIIKILDGLAAQHGLAKDSPVPEGVLASYAAPPTKLGLSIVVVEEGAGEVTTVAISPVSLGLDLTAARRALIEAVDAALKQAFGERCKTAS